MRALFMVEQGRMGVEEALGAAATEMRGRADPSFALEMVRGTLDHLAAIDEALESHLRSWVMQQLPALDRTILRLGAYELLFTPSPLGAVIDEAVSLAKLYSTSDSGRYVNGVLGAIARRSAAAAAPDGPEPGSPPSQPEPAQPAAEPDRQEPPPRGRS